MKTLANIAVLLFPFALPVSLGGVVGCILRGSARRGAWSKGFWWAAGVAALAVYTAWAWTPSPLTTLTVFGIAAFVARFWLSPTAHPAHSH